MSGEQKVIERHALDGFAPSGSTSIAVIRIESGLYAVVRIQRLSTLGGHDAGSRGHALADAARIAERERAKQG